MLGICKRKDRCFFSRKVRSKQLNRLYNPQSEVQITRVNEADFELQAGKESKKMLEGYSAATNVLITTGTSIIFFLLVCGINERQISRCIEKHSL